MKHEEMFDLVCKANFTRLEDRLKSIDNKIDGITTHLSNYDIRMDRLERKSALQGKIGLLILACFITQVGKFCYDSLITNTNEVTYVTTSTSNNLCALEAP